MAGRVVRDDGSCLRLALLLARAFRRTREHPIKVPHQARVMRPREVLRLLPRAAVGGAEPEVSAKGEPSPLELKVGGGVRDEDLMMTLLFGARGVRCSPTAGE